MIYQYGLMVRCGAVNAKDGGSNPSTGAIGQFDGFLTRKLKTVFN